MRTWSPNFVVDQGIELRPLGLADAPALESLKVGYTSYKSEWLYRGPPEDFIQSAQREHQRSGSLTLGIFERSSLAGVLICNVEPAERSVSFDYMLGNPYRGRGLVTRGIVRLLQYFLGDRRFDEACIGVDPENRKSVAVAERLGFHAAETIPGFIDYGSERGDFRKYRLTSAEWHGIQEGTAD